MSTGEKWLILLPQKWNKQVQYAWRYDPCELAPCANAAQNGSAQLHLMQIPTT